MQSVGVRMERFAKITSAKELMGRIDEYGLLPLGRCAVPGFSLAEMTDEGDWHSGDPESDPWQWRAVAVESGAFAYGKLLEKKSAFVSREWFGHLLNFRREGRDFDLKYLEGQCKAREKKLMDCFPGEERLPAFRLKELAGFSKDGEKGFEGAVTSLQMQTYLVVCGYARKVSKKGEEYGWPVSVYLRPEALFSQSYVDRAYQCPFEASREKLEQWLVKVTGGEAQAVKLLLK